MDIQKEEKFDIIVKEFIEGSLDKLPKQQLEDYHSFLMECGAAKSLNVETYYRICDHIRTLLMHQEAQKKLEELKKPHRASFRLLVSSVILAFFAAVAGLLALPQVQKAVFGSCP